MAEVVKLKQPDRHEGEDLHVDACSCRRSDRSARPKAKEGAAGGCILRLFGGSDQNMSKRRDLGRKRDLRTDQKGMNARARSIQSAILAAEVADSAEKGYRLVLERQIPSVQVHLLWNRRRSAAIGRTRCSWTERSELLDLNRGT